MPTTPAEVCNLALLRIGVRQYIGALDEQTQEAAACAVAYPNAREVLLARFPWRFALRRAALAALAGITYDGWSFAYALPTDCVEVRGFVSPLSAGGPPWVSPYVAMYGPSAEGYAPSVFWAGLSLYRAPYALEGGDLGRVLLTNEAAPTLLYTARVEDVSRYPALFVEALAWKLASDLALALPTKAPLAQGCAAQYERALQQAAAQELRQGGPELPPEGESVRAR